ncbi:arabinofuranosidase catalytic domain-containing protein [Micromonospora sp. NPDC050495]|uniref:arabinofuranosidase catalytic domain-containing protein n=1 Tax=Micromonospora sp. NPDC050495 TaxID=3154936 RepID=UPI0033F8CC08
MPESCSGISRRRLLAGGASRTAGTFHEGAIVAGYPSDSTENSVRANVVAAGRR